MLTDFQNWKFQAEEDSDSDSDDEMEDMDDKEPSAFAGLTRRPPIDIEQLAKQHFDNMIHAKLVTLEPTAEGMLPDVPVSSVSPQPTSPNKDAAMADLTEGNPGTPGAPGGNQTIYTCDQCDKTFTKKSSITRHKYEHSGKFWSLL